LWTVFRVFAFPAGLFAMRTFLRHHGAFGTRAGISFAARFWFVALRAVTIGTGLIAMRAMVFSHRALRTRSGVTIAARLWFVALRAVTIGAGLLPTRAMLRHRALGARTGVTFAARFWLVALRAGLLCHRPFRTRTRACFSLATRLFSFGTARRLLRASGWAAGFQVFAKLLRAFPDLVHPLIGFLFLAGFAEFVRFFLEPAQVVLHPLHTLPQGILGRWRCGWLRRRVLLGQSAHREPQAENHEQTYSFHGRKDERLDTIGF